MSSCLQLRWQRGDQRRGEAILLQSWSERDTGLLSFSSFKALCSGCTDWRVIRTHTSSLPSLSLATWDDAGDSGASDRRRAYSGGSLHVFHQATCTSTYTHFYLPFCSHYSLGGFHVIDFVLDPDQFATSSTFLCLICSQKLDINWTGLTNLLDIPGLK